MMSLMPIKLSLIKLAKFLMGSLESALGVESRMIRESKFMVMMGSLSSLTEN